MESRAHRSSPFNAFSIASGNSERKRSCVMDGDPLQSVDKRLIIVETEAQDFGSGVGTVVTVLDDGGVFGLLQVAVADVPGPAAFDNLENDSHKKRYKMI